MRQNRNFALLLRVIAGVIFIVAATVVALPPRMRADHDLLAWTSFFVALGAVMALLALAVLLQREAQAPPEVHAALSRIQQQLMETQAKLNDVMMMSERASLRRPAASPSLGAAPLPQELKQEMEKLGALIEEVRELSLLPDAERRDRLARHRQERKTTSIKDVFGLVAAHDWPKAERLLITLETQYPNDNEVAQGRSYLNHSRKLFEQETLENTQGEVENLMSMASWEQALARAQSLVDGFPDSGEARNLLARVQRERDAYRQSTVQRMFDEIRHDIERRMWRRALSHAEHLLEQFPDHRLAERIRDQLKTLQDNAEIEERQEMEVRIQEYIRTGRFEDAIELAEDVIRRYPMSPQAESLETLLPKLRELARQGVAEFEGLEGNEPAAAAEAAAPLDGEAKELSTIPASLTAELEEEDAEKPAGHPFLTEGPGIEPSGRQATEP